MESIRLGRTGLKLSAAGLGCGGSSRLGQGTGATVAESVRLVHGALELGINYLDTAADYGTESIVGEALANTRDEVIVSTKAMIRRSDDELMDAAALRASIEASLTALRRDAIDVFHLHGLVPTDYDYASAELLPLLDELRDAGSVRFFALSENFRTDRTHEMAMRAISDGAWDVVMVGFSLLNPVAKTNVLPAAKREDVGIEVMYAVRTALSHPEVLRASVADAVKAGALHEGALDPDDPLGFLVHRGGATSLVEAAYRFARHSYEDGIILTGTGSLEHLRANVASINADPLPEADLQRIEELFGECLYFTGN